jgi:hypothetical protein
MRWFFIAATAAMGLVNIAAAQTAAQDTIPHRIGNRANGFSYQPTPSEVVPREQAAGVRPSVTTQDATNQELEVLDRDLLRKEGDGSSSIPKFAPR